MRTFLTDSRRRLRRRAVVLRRAPACPRSAAGRGAPALHHRMAKADPPLSEEGAGLSRVRQSDAEELLHERCFNSGLLNQTSRHLNVLELESPLTGSEHTDLVVQFSEARSHQSTHWSQYYT